MNDLEEALARIESLECEIAALERKARSPFSRVPQRLSFLTGFVLGGIAGIAFVFERFG